MPRDGTKLALFVDGINTHAAARALGFDIDYKRLLTEFQSRGTLVRAFYYTVIVEDQEFSALRPLIDWLDYNGFTVVTKPAKEFDDGEGRRKLNISVELAIDAMELAEHVGQSVSKGQLLASVWGYDFDPGSNVVDVCVRRLRSKLGFGLIKTVRGEGYQLVGH